MKKFFIALTVLLAVTVSNAEAATQFTDEQLKQIISIAEQNSTATPLKLNIATFQNNFDAFMENFIKGTNAGENTDKMRQIFLIDKPQIVTNGERVLFAKTFMNMVAIVGSLDAEGNFTSLNLVAAQIDDKNAAMINALVLQAFLKGISHDLDAQTLLNETKDNPVVTKGDMKFSFSTADNLDVISVTAN